MVSRSRELVEEYGFTFVGVVLVLFALEMIVLVGLLSAGIDLKPWLLQVEAATGLPVSAVFETAGVVAIAYAITRVLKPFQIAAAVVITPIVVQVIERGRGSAPTEGEEVKAPAAAGGAPPAEVHRERGGPAEPGGHRAGDEAP